MTFATFLRCKALLVYLFLGDKEKRTRNIVTYVDNDARKNMKFKPDHTIANEPS